MTLTVESFDKKKHLNQINSWWNAWGMRIVPEDFYPEIGFIVPEVYAAFLYTTNTSMAFYENVISNPSCFDTQLRHQAIVAVDNALTDKAKQLGLKLIIGKSNNQSILNHANNNGWNIGQEYTSICKVIRENT